MQEEQRQRIIYYAFAVCVGALLLLNWLSIFKKLFGLDTAILATLLCQCPFQARAPRVWLRRVFSP